MDNHLVSAVLQLLSDNIYGKITVDEYDTEGIFEFGNKMTVRPPGARE